MASSRWKRFAFFDRHTLSIPSEVLNDLIPVGGDETSRRSLRSLNLAGQETSNDSVSLVVTTASLPTASKPKESAATSEETYDAMTAMWSSLMACTSPELSPDPNEEQPIQLPSQRQQFQPKDRSPSINATQMDGLVLVFVTSKDTEFVHAFDVTVRCNPPLSLGKELDDLDGWRGYFCPFATTSESPDHILGLASCRTSTGVVHLACISSSNVVVWPDPHLHLSCRRPLTTPRSAPDWSPLTLQSSWTASEGHCRVVDIVEGLVAVGTDLGAVLVFCYATESTTLRPYLRIPPPPTAGVEVVSVKLCFGEERVSVFVAYRLESSAAAMSSSAGVCCYDMPSPAPNVSTLSAPSARHDLDGRYVGSSSLVDANHFSSGFQVTVVSKHTISLHWRPRSALNLHLVGSSGRPLLVFSDGTYWSGAN